MKNLKQISIILLVTISTLFSTSCSNDDDNSSSGTPAETQLTINATNMVGKWYETGYNVSGVDVSANIPLMFQGSCTANKSYFEFLANGTMLRKQFNSTCTATDYSGTFTVANAILTYSNLLNSNSITYVHLGTSSGCQITSLTATTLVTKYTQNNSSIIVTYKKI